MSDLSKVEPLAVSDWDPRLAPIAAKMSGRPLNVHKLMANSPELLMAWWNFRMHVVSGGRLRERHREIIVLRVAVRMKCSYEWASHVERGLIAGLTLPDIECIRSGRAHGGWDRSDQLILRATDECFDQQRISADTRTAMRDEFTTIELMDLIAIFGAYVILGTMINTWGLELDDSIQLPEGVHENT